TVDANGNITGMTLVGNYNFIYALNGCLDTVMVQTKSCSVGQIGDFVWLDANDDGIQNSDEPGVSGVKLQLCRVDAQGNQIGNAIDEQTTDDNGKYLFNNVASDRYKVKIIASSLPVETAVTGKKGVGNNGGIDSDFNPQTLASDVIVIDNANGADNKLGIDAGLTGTCVPNKCLPVSFKKLR
ncbi:MAG: hypothetical protein NWP83_07850, partial [Spirosomaceae bacterium]|nr:hypothetical protein [Spirosomataceae bacterium]